MNFVTKKVLKASETNDHRRAHALIQGYGHLIGSSECGIRFYRLGDDVVCCKSTTQIDFSGHLSQKPFWRPPAHMTPADAE